MLAVLLVLVTRVRDVPEKVNMLVSMAVEPSLRVRVYVTAVQEPELTVNAVMLVVADVNAIW